MPLAQRIDNGLSHHVNKVALFWIKIQHNLCKFEKIKYKNNYGS